MIMEFTFYPFVAKNVEKVEDSWGIYKLADGLKKVVFIGRGNIGTHLPKHLPDGTSPADDVEYFSFEYYDSGEEAYEAYEDMLKDHYKKFGKYPRYNKPLDRAG
ncbi:MAG: hypothetical protein U9R75_06020 [Candidatus Thermoplasmatota archaeon]|nr:hypothetical protein [Candidatus Thermoplasmatota archaeon]